MSNAIYPVLPGLTPEIGRDILPPPVTIKIATSEREYRARSATATKYAYTLKYEFLRSAAAYNELQALVGFYALRGGAFDNWLFDDTDDNIASNDVFGIGDGSTSTFQLLRSFGGFVEPVDATNGPIEVLESGVPLNLLSHGTSFDQAPWQWNSSGGSVTPNTAANPVNGSMDADTLSDANTTDGLALYQLVPIYGPTDTSTYVASVYIAKTSGGVSPTTVMVLIFQGGGAAAAYSIAVNTDTGVLLEVSPGANGIVTSLGGYWRVSVSAANNGSGNGVALYGIYPASGPHGSLGGDNTVTGSIVAWGAKVELGSVPTAYTDRVYGWNWSTGTVSITPAPDAGAGLTWSGKFYRRCRFSDPKLSVAKFMQNLWSAGSVKFQTVVGESA